VPVVRRIRKRGATITVESHAEILFMPTGQIHSWTNRFTGRIRAGTIAEAPTNVRPRWGHYGKPLKDTIVSARPRFWGNGRDKQRVYGAVGATAPHAYYVDQGTGIYAGGSPWKAKILPPWQYGGESLYEHTWRPGGPGFRRVAPVMIKGQRPQFFFAKGLKRAFQSMRMRSYQVPYDPKIDTVSEAVATGLPGHKGNTVNNSAFRASLQQWREWRDDAWNRGDSLNRSQFNAEARLAAVEKRNAAKKKSAAPKKPKAKKPVKKPVVKKPPTHKPTVQEIHNKQRLAQRAEEKQKITEFIRNKFPGVKVKIDEMDLFHIGSKFEWHIIAVINGVPRKFTVPSGIKS
jgi:hypothetical protein